MSEAFDLTPPDDNEPDGLTLSALISSRVCHDLINPVGALSSGLAALDDPKIDGPMRDAAMELVKSGAQKAIALLAYARLAYGAAGGFGAQISLDDARKALEDLFALTKATLRWEIGSGLAAKENVKVLMVVAYAAADCVPRGGDVIIDGAINDFTVTARGQKVYLNDALVRALAGDAGEITPKFTPALIAAQLVESAGGAISAFRDEDQAVFKVSFPDQGL